MVSPFADDAAAILVETRGSLIPDAARDNRMPCAVDVTGCGPMSAIGLCHGGCARYRKAIAHDRRRSNPMLPRALAKRQILFARAPYPRIFTPAGSYAGESSRTAGRRSPMTSISNPESAPASSFST